MKTYLVGGAIRDKLLKLDVKERDFVVVGSCEQEMLKKGFLKVGKDFPVFLHPKTKEEYALARFEKKESKGYKGFSFDTKEVTLKEDLKRRDLTINAIAMDENNNLIDPFGGLKDLKNKQLQHVSYAFVEDPLRVFRVARFYAKFYSLGFKIAKTTLNLMQEIVLSKEILALSTDRVWQETKKALLTNHPSVYFQTLKMINALKDFFPELEAQEGIANPKKWHPEIDTWLHTKLVLDKSVRLSSHLDVRFAALCHDFGKIKTQKKDLPHHPNHGEKGVALINDFCKRLNISKKNKDLAIVVSKYHTKIHKVLSLDSKEIVQLFLDLKPFRQNNNFIKILITCKADFYGRYNFASKKYYSSSFLYLLYRKTKNITADSLIKQGLKGKEIKEGLNFIYIKAVDKLRDEFIKRIDNI